MKKNDRRQGRPDRFLGPLIKSAAADYAKAYMRDAENPPLRMPVELDEKCRGIIQAHQCSRTSRIRVALVAAVIAALLGMTSFAVYSEVRRELVMKRQKVDEGCRITFDGTDGNAETYDEQALPDITLNYIPDGFKCITTGKTTVKYTDKNGNSFVVDITQISYWTTIMFNTEGEYTTSVVCNGYEVFKSIGEINGCTRISYLWYDTDRGLVYNLMTVGLDENETLKILDGMNYEKK